MKYLIVILLIASIFRFYNLNWDNDWYLHPDERMIVLVTTRIHWPENSLEWQQIFTPESPLNPKFFAYGSLPLYLLKITGSLSASLLDPRFGSYEKINLVGRVLSTLFDLGTVSILFILGKKLKDEKLGILASFFYAFAVLPIQLSHFYAVDTPLTFFILAVLYRLICFYENPTKKNAIFGGILFGLSLATKISAVVLLVPIITILLAEFILTFLKQPHAFHLWLPKFFKKLFLQGGLIGSLAFVTFVLVEPFAILDFSTFWQQTLEQGRMTNDAFTFPYTLQYVGKIPYFYELKNILLWGLGPMLGTLAFAGALFFIYKTLKPFNFKFLILASFFWVYFAIVGHFAIGFMRYMLPIYPLLCLFAAVLVYQLLLNLKSLIITHQYFFIAWCLLLGIFLLIWPFSFIHIYSQPNTRIQATNWINLSIPQGESIAVEHWDDGLPLGTQTRYQIYELPMYDPDVSPLKWEKVNLALSNAQYIIIASNRLYVPLQKLRQCEILPPGKCYAKTAQYYQNLFNGSLGFKKIKEFAVYPTVPFLNLPIIDFSADESFTVYDHPKVIIFKKV